MSAPAWPNLFVVGAGKAGTTSLWRYLGQHPEIFMSRLKEPCFFATSTFPRVTPTVADREAYLELFAGSRESLTGEASPTYLTAEHAPAAIKAASPDAKVLISLREPVGRTHSLYLEMVRNGAERRPFVEAVQDELLRGIARPPFVASTLYAGAVDRYMKTFGHRVHVLFFESLASNPRQVMRDVYEFLDVAPDFAENLDVSAHNRFAMPRGAIAGKLIASGAARRVARRMVPSVYRDRIYRALLRPVEKPQPEPEAVRLLTEAYDPDVLALAELLGCRFPAAWEHRFPELGSGGWLEGRATAAGG